MTEHGTEKRKDYRKLLTLGVLLVLALLVLAARLFYLQVANDENYTTLSEQNRIRILSMPARRGNIYDANMKELAVSKPVFTIALATTEISDREGLANTLAPLLDDPEITPESILATMAAGNGGRVYEPVVIKRLPYEEGLATVTRLEEMRDQLPGMVISTEPMRYYPQGNVAGHVLGTVGLLSAEEEDLIDEFNYSNNDWLGKTGVEASMERYTVDGKEIGLRGKKGMEKVEVDSNSRPVRTISSQEPVSGNSLVLTLDADVQKVLEDSLQAMIEKVQKEHPKCRRGAAVLLNVKTGQVIAMASYPQMNPNDFANGLPSSLTEYYFQNEDRPLINRAIAGTYPPGSTMKPATAVAVMASGDISPQERITCTPSAWKAPRAKCPRVHGSVNLSRALALSCNTYFQEMAYRIGIEALDKVWAELGFGEKTGIDLPGEAAGVLPSPEWKAEHFDEDDWEHEWHNYDTFYMSMGQGYNTATPLQLANYVATIANGGQHMIPYVVDRILSPQGEVVHQFEPQVKNTLNVTEEDLDAVRQGMRAVIAPGGSASSVFKGFPIEVAGKTGTAQTGLKGDEDDYHGAFVAFAPYEEPEVAFACLIEYGYRGGTTGGVVCREVLGEYFDLNPEPLPNDLPDTEE